MLNRLSFILVVIVGFLTNVHAQSDTLPYEKYDQHYIVYTDVGFSTAPMKIKYPFANGIDKIKFVSNSKMVWGFGFAHKWFNLRLGLNLPLTLRSQKKFGPTSNYDLGFDFSLKQFFFDVDLHYYQGYNLKNAYTWNDTLDQKYEPNLYLNDLKAASFSINAWQFWNPHFKMQAFRGKTASYTKDIRTFYLKYNMSLYGVSNEKGLIPVELIDTSNTKTSATSMTSFDMGIIPGYAYVKRLQHFQIGIMTGLGLVLQNKSYYTEGLNRNFLGLGFRYDVRLVAGYNRPHFFMMFVSDFDNKSFKFNEVKFFQTYYNLKLAAGYRFDNKKDRKAKKK